MSPISMYCIDNGKVYDHPLIWIRTQYFFRASGGMFCRSQALAEVCGVWCTVCVSVFALVLCCVRKAEASKGRKATK
jgi:hypothetical protein